jgi:hypothetical protein
MWIARRRVTQAASVGGAPHILAGRIIGTDHPGSPFTELMGGRICSLMRRRTVASLTLS